MSYDIELTDPVTGDVLHSDAKHTMVGGTYVVGGTTALALNITYNYANHLVLLGEGGVRGIYGKSGAESIPLLTEAINQLGDDIDKDYWKSTEGNVKRALLQLVSMAKMRPDGVWDGD